jgi:radical SAM protein with 4Fe4S-binding SPASM domain
MFFRLNPEARMVLGVKKGVIYDFFSNDIYSIKGEEGAVLRLAEENIDSKEISKKLDISEEFIMDIFKKLNKRELGEFYEKPPFIEPLHTNYPFSNKTFFKQPPICTKLFVELNNSCDSQQCAYCGNEKLNRLFSCMGCNVWKESKMEILPVESYVSILDQAIKLNFREIILTGGNVFKDLDKLATLLKYLEKVNFSNVILILHEKQFKEDYIAFLKQFKTINIALNFDIPINEKASEKISKIIHNLSQNIFLIGIINLSKFGSKEELMEKVNCEYKKIVVKNKKNKVGWQVDFSSSNFSKDYLKVPIFGKSRLLSPKVFLYEWCQEFHPCLGGMLNVASNGYVYVCRVIKEKPVGNILQEGSLSQVIRSKKNEIENFWHLTKDNIEKCRDCEFRYLCNDCRAIEKDFLQTSLCTYDPYKGRWFDDFSQKR